MTIYLLEALDTQFYRGTLPFDAGADGFASTEPLPWPSTLYGAWRTVGLVKHKQLDQGKIGQNHAVWGDASQRGSFTLKGPFLWRNRDNFHEILLPMPADLVATTEERPRIKFCLPDLSQQLAECTDLCLFDKGLRRLHIWKRTWEGKMENLAERFLSHDQLTDYLSQKMDNRLCGQNRHPHRNRLFHPEPRVGIKRSHASHQAEDGWLYAARHHRFAAPCHSQKELGYWVQLDGNGQQLGLPQEGVLKLGGEGRAARYRQLQPTDPLSTPAWAVAHKNEVVECIAQHGQFKLYLLTPGLFGGRAHPFQEASKTITLSINQTIQATLVGLATYKPVLIGGWDMQKRFPKPLITGMPAGTVYFFQINNLPEPADERQQVAQQVFDALNFQSICPDDISKEGFGLVLVGGWYV